MDETIETLRDDRDRWRKETFKMADWAGFQTNKLREARKVLAAVEAWHNANNAIWTTRVHDGNEAHTLELAADQAHDDLIAAFEEWKALDAHRPEPYSEPNECCGKCSYGLCYIDAQNGEQFTGR
jgi:hypothetical protein